MALFVTGVVAIHYSSRSLTPAAQLSASDAFNATSIAAESFLYVSLGFFVFQYLVPSQWSVNFIVITLGLLMAVRAFAVVLCAFIYNRFSKQGRIKWKGQVILWWAGLIRGSLTFALALQIESPHHDTLVTTAFAIVLITSVGFGALTKPLLTFLAATPEDGGGIPENPRMIRLLSDEKVHTAWKKLDHKLLFPLFGGNEARIARPPADPSEEPLLASSNHDFPFSHHSSIPIRDGTFTT